jgi:hypothetical protein
MRYKIPKLIPTLICLITVGLFAARVPFPGFESILPAHSVSKQLSKDVNFIPHVVAQQLIQGEIDKIINRLMRLKSMFGKLLIVTDFYVRIFMKTAVLEV